MNKVATISSGVIGALVCLFSLFMAFLLLKCTNTKKVIIYLFIFVTLLSLIQNILSIVKPDTLIDPTAKSAPSLSKDEGNGLVVGLLLATNKDLSTPIPGQDASEFYIAKIKNMNVIDIPQFVSTINKTLTSRGSKKNVTYEDIKEYIRRKNIIFKEGYKWDPTPKPNIPWWAWVLLIASLILLFLYLFLSLYIVVKLFTCDNVSKVLSVVYLLCVLISSTVRSYAYKTST